MATVVSVLPRLPPHRPNAATKAAYQDKVAAFCATILEVRSRLDFDVGSRGWAYILEGERFIDKDEIDAAQILINDCRKSGDLPLDICSEDDKRAAENLETIDPGPQERAAGIFNYIQTAEKYYTPFSFWDDLDVYVQMAVEKSNLKNLFSKVCAEFCVPIANVGGWADLNVRAGFMQRFKEKEAEGKHACCSTVPTSIPAACTFRNSCARTSKPWRAPSAGRPTISASTASDLITTSSSGEGLTWIENLATAKGEYPLNDKRHPDHFKPYVQDYLREYGVRKVESDALLKRPEAGRELCRQAILRYVPANAPRNYRKKLKPVRADLRCELDRLLRGWRPKGAS